MLTIREAQFAELGRISREAFSRRLHEHLERYFPRQTALAGPAAVDALIELGVDRAAARDLRSVAAVRSFIDHMVMHGAFFDADPLLVELAAPLDDPDVGGPIARMDAVHARAAAWRAEVNGPEAVSLFRALARLRAWLSRSDSFAFDGAGGVGALYGRIFPEAAERAGPARVGAAVVQAGEAAAAWGARSAEARALHQLLALVAGAGFSSDPMLIGAAGDSGPLLAGSRPDLDRDMALFTAAAGLLDRALAGARGAGDA